MVAISDKYTINNKKLDRRYKLTDEQKIEIFHLYKKIQSMRKLASMYGVERTTIRNIVRPEKYQAQLDRYKIERHSVKYYDRKKHTEAMRDHGKYKLKLLEEGLIK